MASSRQDVLGKTQAAAAHRARSENQGEQLADAERARADLAKALARPLG
jgi:hypothetical protein